MTAVDFAATALAQARSTAEAMGPDVAGRIDWVEADLGSWSPEVGAYALVVCLYVHVAGSVEEFAERMAAGVAGGGILFMAGHHPLDQNQISVDAARAVLDADGWEVVLAEERPRPGADTEFDAVIMARRR